jgi:hypothetical protein
MKRPGPYAVQTWRCISEHGQCCHCMDQSRSGRSGYWCMLLDLDLWAHALTPTSCPFHPHTIAEPGMIERAERVSRGYVRDLLEGYPL